MSRVFAVMFLSAAALAACAPETIMASKDQVVVDAASPGGAVARAQQECSRYQRKPYYLRSNFRTYWFLCLPEKTVEAQLRRGPAEDSGYGGRSRRNEISVDRRYDRRRPQRDAYLPPRSAPARMMPPVVAPAPPQPYALQQPRLAPGYTVGQAPFMPHPGVAQPQRGHVASIQPLAVPQLQPGMPQFVPTQPPVMLVPQMQQPQIIVRSQQPAAPPTIITESAPPVVVDAAPQGRFWIQVGASRTREQAAAQGRRIIRRNGGLLANRRVAVQRADVGGRGIYYRTHVGPFASRAAADNSCGSLKKRNHPCFTARR